MIFGLGDSLSAQMSTFLPAAETSQVESPAELASDAALSALLDAMKQAIATRCNSTDMANPCIAAGLAQYQQAVGAALVSCQGSSTHIDFNNCVRAALTASPSAVAAASTSTSTSTSSSTASTCKMSILPSLNICDTYIILGGAAVAVLILLGMGSKKGQG